MDWWFEHSHLQMDSCFAHTPLQMGFLVYHRRPLSKWGHTGVATGFMGLALAIASVGIIDLIAKGYGTMAWGFFAVYFVPLMTVGVWKLAQPEVQS